MRTDKTPRPTGMAMAFYIAAIQDRDAPAAEKVRSAINRNVGLTREREVEAKVSFRTAQKLKQQGVL